MMLKKSCNKELEHKSEANQSELLMRSRRPTQIKVNHCKLHFSYFSSTSIQHGNHSFLERLT